MLVDPPPTDVRHRPQARDVRRAVSTEYEGAWGGREERSECARCCELLGLGEEVEERCDVDDGDVASEGCERGEVVRTTVRRRIV